MSMVYAIHRIQRRDANGKCHAIPAKGCFECSGKEFDHLMNAGAIRMATKAEIAAAEDNVDLHPKKRLARARTLKELRAIKAAKEFSAEERNVGGDEGDEAPGGQEPQSEDDNKKEAKAPVKGGKTGGKKNLV